MSQTIVITGASRGIGAEFVKQYSEKGHTVIACARAPEKSEKLTALVDNKRVFAISLDTVNTASVKAAVEQISKIAPNGIDVLINNAGVGAEKEYTALNTDGQDFIRVFETNVVGTSNVTQALLPLLKQKQTRHIFNITSILGSLKNTTFSSGLSYRVSKAAENMLTRATAGTLAEEGFVVVAIHPGWVKTDMGGSDAPLEAPDAVSKMIETFGAFTKEHNGEFISFEGKKLDW